MLVRHFDALEPEQLRLFETQLPQRLAQLRQRGERLRRSGWDINTLLLLAADSALMAEGCRRLGGDALATALADLHSASSPLLDPPRHPDEQAIGRIIQALDALAAQRLPQPAELATTIRRSIAIAGPTYESGFPLLVTPPANYWTRFGSAPAPRRPPPEPVQEAPPAPPAPEPAAKPIAPAAPAVTQPSAETSVAKPAEETTSTLLVYHLGSGERADAIDAQLATRGYSVTRFARVDAAVAALSTRAPTLMLIDDTSGDALDAVGTAIKRLRKEIEHPIWLVALSGPADVPARLHAIRVGCDALIETPPDANAVVTRILDLTEAARSDPYRIMIIEDDRSQTVFAESILRKAGMRTLAVDDALAALDALDRFQPDLILMDLYMPGCDGIDLTALIRQREAFVATPIVFLSGEHNADKQFEAIDAGGDDFLAKPIRPRHLISAVTNRVRRTRQLRRHVSPATPTVSERPTPAELMRRISECLVMDDAHTRAGGLLVFEPVDPAPLSRMNKKRRAALSDEVTALLAAHAGARDLVTATDDGRWLVFNPDRDASLLEAYALNLRDRVAHAAFPAMEAGTPLQLDVGICPFVAGATRAERMLEAAHDAIERARGSGQHGVVVVRDVAAESDTGLSERIRSALSGSGFQLVFQPIVSLRGEEQEQFQVLLRLRGDEGRMHTAAEVIPAAENAALINDVDHWVLQHSAAVIAERLRAGQNLHLFVNLSPTSVRTAGHLHWLRNLVARSEMPGQSISLELRAADAASLGIQFEQWADAVHELGFGVTLASIEAGSIADALLKTPAVDHVKLASRYQRSADEGTRNELRALVDLAHDNGKRVIAPRVEDARAAAALWTAGVDLIQGNFVQQVGQDLAYDFHTSAL